ncbi:MAG: glutathione S-transferase N-terminal domain-containing protein [Alphaproteobacteria bacterium]|nr:glutathione S-transferase N-terminal domain-containing protein [Alphaproteobacteria bacterium]
MALTLFFAPDNASLAPHIALRKIGTAFDLVAIDKSKNDQNSDWYAALNPHQRVPTLVHRNPSTGDTIVRESAAICLYLNDQFPDANLMPPAKSHDRAVALDWLIYLTNTVQADLMVWNYNYRYAETELHKAELRRMTGARLVQMFKTLDQYLSAGGPWISGQSPSCADYFLLMLAGWGEQFGISPLPSSNANIKRHALACQALPEVQAAFDAEQISFFFQ